MTTYTDRVIDGLGPAFTDRAGTLLRPLIDALTGPLATTDQLLTAPTPTTQWPTLFDLDATPHPAWLGQTTGTRVPPGLTPEQARDYIRDRRAWRRGTPAAIRAAVTAQLRGSRRAELLERDGSPWHLTIRVYASEVPDGDTAPLTAAAETQKPVGITLALDVLTGATYQHMTTTHGPDYQTWATTFPTYPDARDHVPEA